MKRLISVLFFLSVMEAVAATTNKIGDVVLVNDAGDTRPPNSIATPAQISLATNTSAGVRITATNVQAQCADVLAQAQACQQKTSLYSTNYVVTSTVYVQSIGGVPYDPSNQTINVQSIALNSSNLTILATVTQTPLTAPKLDFRQSLLTGGWSNIAATVSTTDIPAGVTNAAAAYLFTLTRPATNAFFRVVDNSTGASGSGLYWLVYGGIWVDGRRGMTGTLTNIVGAVTNTWAVKGGVIVEPNPL